MKTLLRKIGRSIPDIKYVRAIPNRILAPLHRRLGYDGGCVDVLGSQMILNTDECIDTGLWFQPHIYDGRERDFVLKNASTGIFLDVGANIGVWSLFLARNFPDSKIISFEANPETTKLLNKNILLNKYRNIDVISCGVGEDSNILKLYLNTTGNHGGDSFVIKDDRTESVDVNVRRLSEILIEREISAIEFMKIDIEGMEVPVFQDIFERCDHTVWPRLICAEVIHSRSLSDLLEQYGYRVVLRARDNSMFLKSSSN